MEREFEKEVGNYFKSEMYDEMYNAIIYFLLSCEIREGKFEGNEVLINKIDRKTALVYKEYELQDGWFEYSHNAKIYDIKQLIILLNEYKNNL